MATVISSLISAAVTLAICLITNHSQQTKTLALVEYRLNRIEEKMEKHNHVIERTYRLEGRMNEAEHDIRDLKGVRK